MRLDYYHTGNATQEMFSFDRVVIEPPLQPGDMSKTIDNTNLGNYFFEVRDQASGKLLYSRGFSALFDEWVDTEEAKKLNRTFSESLRFPAPSAPVKIVLKERKEGKDVDFHEVWSTTIDPKDKFIDRTNPPSPGPLMTIQKMGEPETKVNLLILGDGYTAQERGKFEDDAKRATEILFSRSPFKEHRKDFNDVGIMPAGQRAGISRPSTGQYRHPPLGTSYDTFDSERYIMTTDNKALRDAASWAPYEFIEILTHSQTYGGGGIFNLYATVAADSEWMPYVFVHEFGHHFAGLADEYYTSDVAIEPSGQRIEPWEPNATALLDPAMLKVEGPGGCGNAGAERRGARPSLRRTRKIFRRSGGRFGRRTGRKARWMRSSRKRRSTKMNCWARTSTRIALARSRAPTMRRAASIGRRKTASCSLAMTASAPCAGAPLKKSLACTLLNTEGSKNVVRRRTCLFQESSTRGTGRWAPIYICSVAAPTLDLGY